MKTVHETILDILQPQVGKIIKAIQDEIISDIVQVTLDYADYKGNYNEIHEKIMNDLNERLNNAD